MQQSKCLLRLLELLLNLVADGAQLLHLVLRVDLLQEARAQLLLDLVDEL